MSSRERPRPLRSRLSSPATTESRTEDFDVAKAYWVTEYRVIRDSAKIAAYAELAHPAIIAAGGRFLARGNPAHAFESGTTERITLIEFDSVEHALAAYRSPAYQRALAALGDGADRDIRIIEGT
jgi:uncharacterized protein (DUF1330 family)